MMARFVMVPVRKTSKYLSSVEGLNPLLPHDARADVR
jgi:hypothetical protein